MRRAIRRDGAGHQLQVLYSAFPALRLVPGLYSAWLRLWGSRVGRAVYWTPQVKITDRGLLKVGDGVVFGHRVVSIPKGSTRIRQYSKGAVACSARSSPR